jgi:ERF superfamily
MTLAEKLHAIQRLAKKVPKRGKHERGWSYVRIEDVVTVATRFMAEHKLVLTPKVKSLTRSERSGGSVVDLMVEWTLMALELADYPAMHSLVFEVPGSGFDYDSKGTAKALTDSRKNAMILLFNLKGGDDPEKAPATRVEAKNSREEIVEQKLANHAAGRGIDADVRKLFYEYFPQSKTYELTGDKELLKDPMLKKYRLMGKLIVKEEEWESLKLRIEETGVPLSNLRTQ